MSTRVSPARQGDVVYLRFESPSGLHVLTRDALHCLRDQLRALVPDDGIRGVVLTGAGERAFSAGADLRELAGLDVQEAMAFSALGQGVAEAIASLPLPVVALLNGPAYGGGIELALACDFRIATPHAHLQYQAARLGLLPGWGGTQRLPRLIGPARARRMMLAGERISPPEAQAWGLIDAVADAAAPSDAVEAYVSRWREADPLALRQIKQALEAALPGNFPAEQAAFAACFSSGDTQARIRTWLERSRATAPPPVPHPEPSTDGARCAAGPAEGT